MLLTWVKSGNLNRFYGKDRIEFMERILVGDVLSQKQSNSSLSLILNNDAGIIDDCIFSTHDQFHNLVVNAGNKDIDFKHFKEIQKNEFSKKDVQLVQIEDESLIAIQGPNAYKILQPLLKTNLQNIKFNTFFKETPKGFTKEITFYRLGYTGEDGFEISIANSEAESFITFLLDSNKNDLIMAGLGARDALRLEAGLCLHGHDIDANKNPVEAMLQWTIRKRPNSNTFIGSEKLESLKKVI